MIAAFCDSVDRFARASVDARRIDAAHRIEPAVIEGLAELGVFGVSIPEAYGGADLGLPGVCSVVTTLARHDRSVATTVGLHLGLGTRGLVAFGSDALKAAWLPDLAAGRRIAAFATTEAGAGSDLAAIRTRALPVPASDQLEVDGEKIFVTNGGFARVYTLTAATPGLGGARKGHSLLLVAREDAGVTAGPEEDKLGLRGSSTTTLHLDAVRVPADRVIGVPGEGMTHLGHVLAWGRTVLAAGCVGSADAALGATVAYVAQRRQFGRTLDAFEVVREQVAEMAAVRFAMEALVRAASRLSGEHLLSRSVAAKVFCSEGNWEIVDTAIQLHGGVGYIEETGLALLLRDARITRIFEGANDVLRVHLGTIEAMSPPERRPLRGISPLGRVADAFDAGVEELRAHLRGRYGIRLAREQRLLHRLGQLAVLRDACDAAVVRAAEEETPASADLAAHWLALARARSAALLPEPPRPAELVDRIAGALHA
ncbi:MAG: acyl-CoA dehydrogenase family protein [Pseudomonadota bacterium]|nr:acyl-CoA dehydrogenase family protein [Pseudomonadota bacterium]